MPHTANWHRLGDPFNPIEALRHSAAYLRELRERFGNLGLAAAAYNAGPARISAWLTNHRNQHNRRALPSETRNYVVIVTGRTADEWASPLSLPEADTNIPQGVPCTRLANLLLAPTAALPSPPQTEKTIPQDVANLILAPRAASSSLPIFGLLRPVYRCARSDLVRIVARLQNKIAPTRPISLSRRDFG
jgi:hypothetical protein